jgi:hypothetical protein
MINKINKERQRSMNATPTRPSNKNQWQGAQADPKQKQDRAQGRKNCPPTRRTRSGMDTKDAGCLKKVGSWPLLIER